MAESTQGYGYGYGYSERSSRNHMAIVVFAFVLALFIGVYMLAMFDYVTFSLQLMFGVVIAAIVYLLTLYDIKIGLGLMLLSIGISPEIQVGGINNLRLEDFLVPVIFFAWLTRFIRSRSKLEPTNLKAPIVIYIGVMLISSLIAMVYGNLEGMRSFFVFGKMCEYYLIFFIVLNTLKTKREIKSFIVLMLVVSALTAIYGIYAYHSTPSMANEVVSQRLTGPSGETANILGGYFIFHMLIAAGIVFHTGIKKYTKWLALYFVIMLYPLIHTLSRTSYVALFGGLFLLGLMKNKKILFFAMILFLAIPLFTDTKALLRMKTIADIVSDDPPPSWEARISGWRMIVDRLASSPLLGFGVGHTGLAIDSEYVRVAGDIGLIGLIIFMWMLFKMAKTSYQTNSLAKDEFLSGYALGYLGGLMALAIHAIAATTFTTIRTMEPFFFGTGLLYIIYNRYSALEEAPYTPQVEQEEPFETDDVFIFADEGLSFYDEEDLEPAGQ